MQRGNCPICNSPSELPEVHSGNSVPIWTIRCARRGKYSIYDVVKEGITRALQMNNHDVTHYLSICDAPDQRSDIELFIEVAKKAANETRMDIPRSIVGHALRKRIDKREPLTYSLVAGILKKNSVLTPAEQANNFVNYLGERLSSPVDWYEIFTQQKWQENIYGLLGLKTGTIEEKDFHFIIKALEGKKLLNVDYGADVSGRKIPLHASLTLNGWQKYGELQHSIKDSRRAFVAMEFANPEKPEENYFFQTKLLDVYLVPAVKKTGYDLANALRTEPMAGNIHARLEVEIRAARFVVAELSHHNNGAYWEAGFARGLGKPVIYMFNKKIGKSVRPHFDVGSDLYIPWEENKPQKAGDDLKAVIRATLFGEAVMEDRPT